MLARYGIDYAEAMERFCGNESLFARIAVKYLDDPHVDALEAAMASGDAAAAEREAHSLKGVAGNLSFVRLYDLAARVTDALRANDIDSARTLMPDLRESHVAVLEALKNLEEWGLSTSMR
ncbi:Hpt domain-containing protein [Eggerthella lenta]|nr:Hpt domain-containing protein [Eggerthella lenta]MDB1785753.1 Hpt domain-containing protein [Eggerthella lenta]MDB1791715.1 Hpt domain-containing protein [Eggerthella lenta]